MNRTDIILGWPSSAAFSSNLAMRVMNLCAELRRCRRLGWVIASFPPPGAAADRERLFALAASLRRAGERPLIALCEVASTDAEHLDECVDRGVAAFAFLEDQPSPRRAIALVSASRLAAAANAQVDLWLSDNALGTFQGHMAAWTSAFPFSFEARRAPFSPVPRPAGAAGRGGHEPVHCEWLRGTVTLVGSGELAPCPDHLGSGVEVPLGGTQDQRAIRTGWLETLGGSAPCRGCARDVRFRSGELLGRHRPPAEAPAPTYHDHVGRDISTAPRATAAGLSKAFEDRLAASSRGRGKP